MLFYSQTTAAVDLADTALGTGIISMNEAGDTAVMNNVVYCNAEPPCDNELPSRGFCFCDYHMPVQVFTLEIHGDCRIDNVMFQEEYNSAGLAVLFNVWNSEAKLETAKIIGDGTLTVKGGEALIYSDCNLDIDCGLVFDSYDTHYTDGIRSMGSVSIHDRSIASKKLNGRIVYSGYGEVSVSGCTVDAACSVPLVTGGAAAYRALSGKTGLEISDSDISIGVSVHGDWFPNGVGQSAGLYSEGSAPATGRIFYYHSNSFFKASRLKIRIFAAQCLPAESPDGRENGNHRKNLARDSAV